MREHPGPPQPGDLDQCGLCGSPALQAVTVYRLNEPDASLVLSGKNFKAAHYGKTKHHASGDAAGNS